MDQICLYCEHWLGNARVYDGNFESCRQETGKCHDSRSNNPHYYNGDYLSAYDGCQFWKKHFRLAELEQQERKERERREWLASPEGQRWQEEERRKQKLKEEEERKAREAAEKAAKEAAEKYRTAAEQGDAEAQFNLGHAYELGEGVPKDYDKAAKWYGKAAEQGIAEAQYCLGLMYMGGKGFLQNSVKAYKLIRKAAKQGCIEAIAYITRERADKLERIGCIVRIFAWVLQIIAVIMIFFWLVQAEGIKTAIAWTFAIIPFFIIPFLVLFFASSYSIVKRIIFLVLGILFPLFFIIGCILDPPEGVALILLFGLGILASNILTFIFPKD